MKEKKNEGKQKERERDTQIEILWKTKEQF